MNCRHRPATYPIVPQIHWDRRIVSLDSLGYVVQFTNVEKMCRGLRVLPDGCDRTLPPCLNSSIVPLSCSPCLTSSIVPLSSFLTSSIVSLRHTVVGTVWLSTTVVAS